MEFPERLRLALNRWGGSHQAFAEYLKELGVLGASPRQLARYLGGKGEPGMAWIKAACTALNVSADWLIFGEGSMDSANVPNLGKPEVAELAKVLEEEVMRRGHYWFDFSDQIVLGFFCLRLATLRPEKFGFADRSQVRSLSTISAEQVWHIVDEIFPTLREDSPFAVIDEGDLWAQAHSAFYASLSAAWANEMPYMIGKKRRT